MPEATARSRGRRALLDSHETIALDGGWQAAACEPGACPDPSGLAALAWLPARIPGTAAGVLRDAGRWQPGEEHDFDAEDWWFRTSFTSRPAGAGEEVVLELDGIATVADVYLNGELLLAGESMFAPGAVDVGALLREENELAIRCHALAPLLEQSRRPRARWRTRLVDGNLRFFRTMLLGRAPGFAPGPAAVGPWRAVRLVRRRLLVLEDLDVRTRVEAHGENSLRAGLLSVHARVRGLGGAAIETGELELSGASGSVRGELTVDPEQDGWHLSGSLRVEDVSLWWPHTHGEPALYSLRLGLQTSAGSVTVEAGRTGFRSLAAGADAGHDAEADGLDLHVNGVRVFARGAVWTPADPVGLAPDRDVLRERLQRVCDAGMNMLRIAGTGAYESGDFHDLCDELGLLVWQDFMFANLDYPLADPRFRAAVALEARTVMDELSGRPSLAVVCGNSEIEQQVAMLGLDPALGRGELFGELLPQAVRRRSDAIYLPSAPCGGDLPFRNDRGVAHYFGVGGYLRPLEDARRAEVRFAAECLAFSNVPDEGGVQALAPGEPLEAVLVDPRWKAGIPRDAGASWDFEDVREHYLGLLFGVSPGDLRLADPERYLELARAVTGEVMAEVFGEWRRAASPCGGGLMLWLADLAPGAGFGVIDHAGAPKPAFHHLRRALAPVAVWTTDEGLDGIRVHVVNDRPLALSAQLRVAFYRDGEHRVEQAREPVALAPHAACERDVEAMLGRFVDASWAYRFGPAPHDALVATLELDGAEEPAVISQSFRFPAGRPLALQPADQLGLSGALAEEPHGGYALRLHSARLAYGVRIHVPGFRAADDALTLEPGVPRAIALTPDSRHGAGAAPPGGWLTALNLHGRVPLRMRA